MGTFVEKKLHKAAYNHRMHFISCTCSLH